MRSKAEKICKANSKAETNKRNWTNVLNDVWDYTFPMRHGFYHEAPGQERMEKIFDETPIDAAAEFASIIQEGLFNGKWFRLIPGPGVPQEEKDQVQADLDKINEYIYQILDQSNLESEAYEAILEMAASVGSLYVKEGDVINPIIFQAVSMVYLEFDIDRNGQIDTVYRTRTLKAQDIEREYPDATIPATLQRDYKNNPEKEVKVLETTKRDWDEIGTETHVFSVVIKDKKELIWETTIDGDGSRPWINFRWSADSGQALGRGPLITALPSIRNLNLVKEMGLENAQLHIGGIFQADDDGTYNFDNVEIVPMSVMSRTPGSKGLDPVKLPGNPDMTQFVIQDLQNAIRMILLNNEFGSLEKTPRSAEEIYGRYGKQMKKIRAPLKRLVKELVIPTAKRITYVLKKRGLIELPKIDGRGIAIQARGPLIRMMNALEQEDLLEFVTIVKQMYGPESRLYIHDDKVVKHMAQNKELPSDILVTDTERVALVQELQAAAAPEPGAMPPDQAAPPIQ